MSEAELHTLRSVLANQLLSDIQNTIAAVDATLAEPIIAGDA